jgi:hypothetical protein
VNYFPNSHWLVHVVSPTRPQLHPGQHALRMLRLPKSMLAALFASAALKSAIVGVSTMAMRTFGCE